MNAVRVICSLSLMLSVGLVSVVTADDNKPQAEVHTVSEGRFRVVVPLEGVFVTERMYEVSLRPETWTELTVVEAVEHGREVRKGDLLVRLDRRKIEEQIRDEEAARKHAMLAIEQLQAELHVLEPSIPVDLAAACTRTCRPPLAPLGSAVMLDDWRDVGSGPEPMRSTL